MGTRSSVNNAASLQQVLNPEHSSSPWALPRFRNLPTGVFGTLPENELERDGNELAAGDVIGTNLWRARRTRPPLPALAAARLIPCLVASGKARAASLPWRRPSRGNIPDRSQPPEPPPPRYSPKALSRLSRRGPHVPMLDTDGRGPQKPEEVSVGATRPPGRQPGTVRTRTP